MEEYISAVIAPKLRGDGGWIEFISFEDGILKARFRGECSKCMILDRCLRWIEHEVKRDLGLDITVTAERAKPYFWDVV